MAGSLMNFIVYSILEYMRVAEQYKALTGEDFPKTYQEIMTEVLSEGKERGYIK